MKKYRPILVAKGDKILICIYCQQREATVNDLFCHPCADEIGSEGMAKMRNTIIGQQMLAYKA